MSFTRDNWGNAMGRHVREYGLGLTILHIGILAAIVAAVLWVVS